MIRFKLFLSRHRAEYNVLLVLTLVVLVCLILLDHYKGQLFERFIGDISPVITGSLISIFGFIFLSILIYKARLSIYNKEHLKRALGLLWVLIPILFITIFIDLNIGYPEDINIPFPESLVFYPVIAFFVEIVFHLLPFSILLVFLTTIFKNKDRKLLLWIIILFVAILEPSYQALFMGTHPLWAIALLWINLYLFNIAQLYVFWRCDFVSMYVFRLAYYAVWHIAWGHIRLELLF